MKTKKINIIGGGIGGLTAGIALGQKGFDVEIYESAPEIKAVGAGIVLANNAVQIFEKLNMLDLIIAKGTELTAADITDADLKSIQKTKLLLPTYAIHRADLHKILVSQLGNVKLHLGRKLKDILHKGAKVEAHFEDGFKTNADILIGADGVHSVVRNKISDIATIRNSGQTCWRGTTKFDLPEKYSKQIVEAWGGKGRFGFLSYRKGEVYWYAVSSDSSNNSFIDLFDSFNPLVKEIISSNTSSMHKDVLGDVYPVKYSWHKDNICLIGDAAHAMTPNMGQGACQAIEDGYALSLALDKYPDHKIAFKRFQEIRKSKVNKIVDLSWKLGKAAHWTNPFVSNMRNSLIKITPRFISERQFNELANIKYLEKI